MRNLTWPKSRIARGARAIHPPPNYLCTPGTILCILNSVATHPRGRRSVLASPPTLSLAACVRARTDHRVPSVYGAHVPKIQLRPEERREGRVRDDDQVRDCITGSHVPAPIFDCLGERDGFVEIAPLPSLSSSPFACEHRL